MSSAATSIRPGFAAAWRFVAKHRQTGLDADSDRYGLDDARYVEQHAPAMKQKMIATGFRCAAVRLEIAYFALMRHPRAFTSMRRGKNATTKKDVPRSFLE
jgi:hypothetical protein